MNKDKKNVCIGLLAHVDAGKTTLSEALLYQAGVLKNPGRVDKGDAYLDTFAMEKERGITIFSKQAVFSWEDMQVTLLDTPGHIDFSAEMERTLQVLDYAVLVISGPDGVQGHTQTLWKLLEKYQIPVFIFVNKMDRIGANFYSVLEQTRNRLKANSHPVVIPIGSESNFEGVIDLVKMKEIIWLSEDGMKMEEKDIRAELKEEAEKYRNELLAGGKLQSFRMSYAII